MHYRNLMRSSFLRPAHKLQAETTSMSTTTHPSWLPWAAIVVSILLSHTILSRRHISTSLQKEEEEEAPPPSSSELFPWEPNNTSLSDTNLPSSSSPPQERKLQPSTSSAEEQLQFLACMTFANGGLRSPSCPCC